MNLVGLGCRRKAVRQISKKYRYLEEFRDSLYKREAGAAGKHQSHEHHKTKTIEKDLNIGL
jgi:hypothetical protein